MSSGQKIVIVGGCGHVGLPLGLAFASQGLRVTLLDIDSTKVDEINTSKMPFMEEGVEPLLERHANDDHIRMLEEARIEGLL